MSLSWFRGNKRQIFLTTWSVISFAFVACQHEPVLRQAATFSAIEHGYWCHSQPVSNDLCQLEIELTSLTNEFRYQNGLAPLRHDPALAFVAYQQSQRAARAGTISHAGFPETRQALLQNFDASRQLSIQAENLLRLKTSETDRKLIVRRILYHWQNSPSHRRQLLGPHRAHGASLVFHQGFIFAAAMFQ
ncbi:MAG: CAP domain-containing protein [Oligoflexus sp.]